MLGKTSNPLLQKTEQAVVARVRPELQPGLKRTITAGLQVMYGSKSGIMVKQLSKTPDYAHNVGEGAAKLVGILYQQSKKTMPMTIAVPASIVFMCEGLDFLEKAGSVQVTPELVAEATKDTTAGVLQLLGVSPDKMQQLLAQRQAGGAQPAAAQPAPPSAPAGIIGAAQGA